MLYLFNTLKYRLNSDKSYKIIHFPSVVEKNKFLFFLIISLCLIGYALQTQVILDDSYIYFRVVNNFLNGLGPRFNPDDQNMIATSTGWMWVLIVAKWLLPGIALPALAKNLFIAFLGLTSLLLYELLRRPLPFVALLSPIAVFCAPTLIVLDGHDTALALCANVALILGYARRSRWLPLLVVLAYFARGESIVFGSILVGLTILRADPPLDFARRIGRLIPASIIGSILLATWHGYYWLQFRHIAPSSFRVKILQGHNGWPAFASGWWPHLSLFSGNHYFAYVFLLFGAAVILIRMWPLIAWPVAHFLLYALLGVALYDWYYYPVELVLGLAVITAATEIAGLAIRKLPAIRIDIPAAGINPLITVLALALICLLPLGSAFLQSVTAVKQAAISGRWDAHQYDPRLESYTDTVAAIMADSAGGKAPSVLAAEIGIFGYLLPDSPVYDVVGLTDAAIQAKDLWNWKDYVARLKPDYIIGPPEKDTNVLLQDDRFYKLIYRPKALPAFGLFRKTYAGPGDELGLLRQVQVIPTTAPPAMVDIEDNRLIFYAHAPSILSADVPKGLHRLHIAFGFRSAAWQTGDPKPAQFSIDAVDAQGRSTALWRRSLNPKIEENDRGRQEATIDMPADFAGKVILSITPVASPNYLWTYWSAMSFD